jgi:RND superfamily putative drug exporter
VTSLTRLAARWPGRVLTTWLAAVAVLAVVGLHIEDKLEPTRLILPNTSVAAWDDLRAGTFGDETVIILHGPRAALDREGPKIAGGILREFHAPQVSPWGGRSAVAQQLRPEPGTALIITDVSGGSEVVPPERLERLGTVLDRLVEEPLRATVSGTAPLARAITEESLNAASQAEKIALPLLLLVLLLVFRSPVAAVVPLLVAGATVASGRGVLALLAPTLHLDATSAVLLSMIGLALGVDYSLLIVTRFREALADGDEPRQAATLASFTAGRTAAFAGGTLLAILAVTLLLAPGRILVSVASGAIVGTVIGVSGAMIATPALLVLLGRRVGALPSERDGLLGRIVGAALDRPWRAAALAAAPLIALALGLTGLRTIPPDPHGLPPHSEGAKAFAASTALGLGPGLEIVMHRSDGPITDVRTLRLEQQLERGLARLDGVSTVAGPAPLGAAFESASDAQLAKARRGLRRARRGVARLRKGLGKAGSGADELTGGGATARAGAVQIAAGAGQARAGAAALAEGSARASAGTEQLSAALADAGTSAAALRDGAAQLRTGGDATAAGAARLSAVLAGRLVPALDRLARGLHDGAGALTALREPAEVARDNAHDALAELQQMRVGVVDPHYRSAVTSIATALAALTGRDPRDGSVVRAGYDGLDAALATADDQILRGAAGADRLAAGGHRAADGAQKLANATRSVAGGVTQLGNGIAHLGPGIAQLQGGVEQARGGLGALADGGGQLEGGLGELQRRIAELADGLGRLEAGQAQLAQRLQGARKQLLGDPLEGQSADAPALLGSGFATLAALDTSTPLARAAGRYILNLEQGGDTARIIVLTHLTTTDKRAPGVIRQAQALTADFARRAHVEAAVGGLAPSLTQFADGTQARLPIIILGIALVTFLVLVPVLRSLLLPLIVVGLNLLTVASTFGVLCLLFVGDHPLIGQTGALDVISVCSSFAIIFALSIDYQVFLLARMREGYVLTQDPVEAIRFGAAHTARIVTGAALIMLGTFAAFATTSVASVQQFGFGLAIAILVDATLVRLVLLPAIMKIVGLRAWWLPDWSERKLPELDVEGIGYVRIREDMATRAAELW